MSSPEFEIVLEELKKCVLNDRNKAAFSKRRLKYSRRTRDLVVQAASYRILSLTKLSKQTKLGFSTVEKWTSTQDIKFQELKILENEESKPAPFLKSKVSNSVPLEKHFLESRIDFPIGLGLRFFMEQKHDKIGLGIFFRKEVAE